MAKIFKDFSGQYAYDITCLSPCKSLVALNVWLEQAYLKILHLPFVSGSLHAVGQLAHVVLDICLAVFFLVGAFTF
jgi:hypothetical protein